MSMLTFKIYLEFTMLDDNPGNERLQQMMGIMAQERQGQVFATDERYLYQHLAMHHFN